MENKIPIRFFVITFLWTWLICGVAILILSQGNSQDTVFLAPSGAGLQILMLLGIFGPTVGAFVSIRTIEGKGAVKKYIKSFFSLKFGWKAWSAIFLISGITSFISWFLPELFGEERVSPYLPSISFFPIYLLFSILLGGGQEEIGYKCYISPIIEKKYGIISGEIIHGIIWAVWHIPLWFIPGAAQNYMNFFVFMICCIGYSFFFSWVIELSGNRLLSGLVVHGTANAFSALFPTIITDPDANQLRFLIYSVLIFIIGFVIVLLRAYKGRKICT